MDGFYAYIVPMPPPGAGAPGEPPSIWPSPGYPAHPIAPGGPPPGIWPGPGYPAHPIFLPPGLWPSPGRPAHPIVLPPPPGSPPGIWGPQPGFPTPPIYLPPEKPGDPPKPAEGWSWVWSPYYGWVVQPPGEGGKPQPPAGTEPERKK